MTRSNENSFPSVGMLMEKSFNSHREFKRQFDLWQRGKLGAKYPKTEAPKVTSARDAFWIANDTLFTTKLEPLEFALRDRPHDAFDDLCEFLATDIPAFRCGYAKEFFLQWLKGIQLTPSERAKLAEIALLFCSTDTVRREFRRWCRLMVKIADEEFLGKLNDTIKSASGISRTKANWMLTMILRHRPDLRNDEIQTIGK